MSARPFVLCINYLTEPQGNVWAVIVGKKWHMARAVQCYVPLTTIFKGPNSRQPKAYLRGTGRVSRQLDGTLLITP